MKNSIKLSLLIIALFCASFWNTWVDADIQPYPAYHLGVFSVHPKTGMLYTILDSNVNDTSRLYTIEVQTGELREISDMSFSEITSLTFHPDGSLWSWYQGGGLIKINLQPFEKRL